MIPLKIETLLDGLSCWAHDRVEYKTGWNPEYNYSFNLVTANDYDINTNVRIYCNWGERRKMKHAEVFIPIRRIG